MIKDAIEILKILESKKYKAFIVGGYVRDFYRNMKNPDIDICTSAKPEQLKEIFKDDIITENYGSSVLNYNGNKYEITTFRKEKKYLDHRHPEKIKFVKSLKTDLKRRDFTMNALCLTSDYNYIDYYKGMDDINNKLIRTIGNPDKRLKEDALRILRAIRFATTLDFEIEENLSNAIFSNSESLRNLSYYSRKKELEKIFLHPNKFKGIGLLLKYNLSEALEIYNLKNIVMTESIYGIWAQIENIEQYPFTKEEMNAISSIKKLIGKDLTDPHILYNNELEILKIASQINRQSFDFIVKQYNQLKIHKNNQIAIDFNTIYQIVKDYNAAHELFNEIQHLILTNQLENNYEKIMQYISQKNIQNK